MSNAPTPRTSAARIAASVSDSPNPQALPASVLRVAQTLDSLGHDHAPVMLDAAARTAAQAAQGLGVALGQIAKSIIFKRLADQAPVLVITRGDRRVDETKLTALLGPLGRADADFVRANTGYAIGGVPPLAHNKPAVTLLDQDLQRFAQIWAAAGHPHAVFCLSPAQLARLTNAPWADVAQAPVPPANPAASVA